jgi:hypothetical protein
MKQGKFKFSGEDSVLNGIRNFSKRKHLKLKNISGFFEFIVAAHLKVIDKLERDIYLRA